MQRPWARRLFAWLAAMVALVACAPVARGESAEEFFNEYVLPILKNRCFECHSHAAGKAKGGLVLDSRGGWEKGGDSGTAVVPGKVDESLLIDAVRYDGMEMPPSGKLKAEEISVLERWVAGGAVDPRVIAATTNQKGIDLETGRKHWAFQPPRAVKAPAVKDAAWPLDDLDRFLLAKLEEKGLHPVPDADRYTWLRRVSLDLTGVPPTVEDIETFVGDKSSTAFENVVDRLLAARGFGERWGRHWLDLVGYADQIGTANEIFAQHAWRYRDYVIAAFNADKPFDRFIREQLAGDLLPDRATERESNIVATGFLLLGDLSVVEADKAKLRIDVIDQQVDKVGRAFLGLTLGCARCHDHKFDPIPQRDYYAMAGIFNSTDSVHMAEWGVWSWPTVVNLPESDANRAARQTENERYRERLDALNAERTQLRQQKAEIETVLRKPAPATPDESRGVLEKLQQNLTQRIQKLDGEIQHAEFFAPSQPRAFAVRDAAKPTDMRITIRGNAHALGDQVARGFLQVVPMSAPLAIPTSESGRRQLADWIVARENPLTARVAVNRIWQKLFGEGIVRSVDYFGLPGERPTNPELLDSLALRFVDGGWSQKRLIRALVLSRAYRMSSATDRQDLAVDPENHLLWRMNRRRLDAEGVRDSLLAVSGKLLESSGGPALPLEYPANTGNLEKGAVNPPSFRLARFRPEQAFERTVYAPVVRAGLQGGPAEVLNVFDFTQPAEFAGQRAVTAVPTQALFLLNSRLMKERAGDLAKRILESASDESARLERLWLRALNRPISPTERADAATFLAESQRDGAGGGRDKASAELQSWAELCHSLLASNEFLMRM